MTLEGATFSPSLFTSLLCIVKLLLKEPLPHHNQQMTSKIGSFILSSYIYKKTTTWSIGDAKGIRLNDSKDFVYIDKWVVVTDILTISFAQY